jgi:hypothetical protein
MEPLLLRPFDCDDCCLTTPSSLHIMITEYYKAMRPYLNRLMEELFVSEMYGKDSYCIYTRGNRVHYLLSLLVIIDAERKNDALWNSFYGDGRYVDKGAEYYIEKYDIEKIKEDFSMGEGEDISEALEAFKLDPDSLIPDGIGYMAIEYPIIFEDKLETKPFIVR